MTKRSRWCSAENGQGFAAPDPDACLHKSLTAPWRLAEYVWKPRLERRYQDHRVARKSLCPSHVAKAADRARCGLVARRRLFRPASRGRGSPGHDGGGAVNGGADFRDDRAAGRRQKACRNRKNRRRILINCITLTHDSAAASARIADEIRAWSAAWLFFVQRQPASFRRRLPKTLSLVSTKWP